MKTVKMLTILVLALGLMAWQVEVSEAAPMGTAFSYQGRLLDANDTADGEYDLQFKLFDAPNGGVQQGSTIDINDVDVIDGYFTAELDFGSDVFDGNDRWLQIGVRQGATNDPYTILSPRQEMTPMPYALYAASGPGVPVPLELNGSVVYSGAVIKGTNTGTGYGVYGKHDSSGNYGYLGYSDRGVYGYSSSDYGVRGHGGRYGVYGLSSISGYGAYGKNITSGNFGYLGGSDSGVYGEHNSSGNYGYLGHNYVGVFGHGSSSGYGVYGEHDSGNFGYLGYNDGGVYGLDTDDGFGVFGICTGLNGYGVYGVSSYSYGVYGTSNNDGCGVYGEHDTSGNFGYLGSFSRGVYGFSSDDYGVYGSTDSGSGVFGISDTGYAVHGSSLDGYAGFFNGNMYVTDNVSALAFTDRTPYPKDLVMAYEAVMSMERLPDGQYDENNKQVQLDHSKLSDFIKSKDGNRDLSATVSCHNEILKHLVRKNDELEKAYIHIEQLNKRIIALEAKLVKLETGLNIVQ
jgi:hypothetical protein